MISAADARAVFCGLPVAKVARLAWRAASPDLDAAVVLDAATGAIEVLTWRAGSDPDVPPSAMVLAYAPASRHVGITRALARGVEVPPSEELVEEHVVRLASEAFEAAGLALAREVEERLEAALRAGRAA